MAKEKINKRTLSRLIAVQIFYQENFLTDGKKLEEIKQDMIENYTIDDKETISSYRKKIDEKFLDILLLGMTQNRKNIDEIITKFLRSDFTLEKLDEVMLQILRFGIFELKFLPDIPPKVVINEYVDIAASFFDEKKITFINAALDAVAKKEIVKTTPITLKELWLKSTNSK